MSQFSVLGDAVGGHETQAEEWLESHRHIGEMSGSPAWSALSFSVLDFPGWF